MEKQDANSSPAAGNEARGDDRRPSHQRRGYENRYSHNTRNRHASGENFYKNNQGQGKKNSQPHYSYIDEAHGQNMQQDNYGNRDCQSQYRSNIINADRAQSENMQQYNQDQGNRNNQSHYSNNRVNTDEAQGHYMQQNNQGPSNENYQLQAPINKDNANEAHGENMLQSNQHPVNQNYTPQTQFHKGNVDDTKIENTRLNNQGNRNQHFHKKTYHKNNADKQNSTYDPNYYNRSYNRGGSQYNRNNLSNQTPQYPPHATRADWQQPKQHRKWRKDDKPEPNLESLSVAHEETPNTETPTQSSSNPEESTTQDESIHETDDTINSTHAESEADWETKPNIEPQTQLCSYWEGNKNNLKLPPSKLSADAPEFVLPHTVSKTIKDTVKKIDATKNKESEKRDSSLTFEFYEKKYRKKKIDHVVVTEREGDLFAMSEDYSLANCVAEDMNMGSGIAITFRTKFKGVEELLAQRKKQGNVAYLNRDGRYIYYMVTKRESSKKPTLETMFRSMVCLAALMKEHEVTKLAIPRIGCGLDRLEWSEVKNMLEYVFEGRDVDITVCNFQKNYGQTKQKLKTTSDKSKDGVKIKQKNKKHKGKK